MHQINYYQPYVSPTSVLRIVQTYQAEEKGLTETIKELQKPSKGPLGSYFAAELCLQQASQDYPSHASSWMIKARSLYNTSLDYCNYRYDPSTALKVELRLASIAIFRSLFSQRTLPSLSLIDNHYKKSLQIAKEYDNLLLEPSVNRVDKTGILGSLGEFAVLALLNRWTIKNENHNEILSFKSFFDEDYGYDCLSKEIPKWDIDILQFTKDGISLTDRIQVKSTDDYYSHDHNEVTNLYIKQHLGIHDQESRIISQIIRSCKNEADDRITDSESRKLDDRTDKLLETIDLSKVINVK